VNSVIVRRLAQRPGMENNSRTLVGVMVKKSANRRARLPGLAYQRLKSPSKKLLRKSKPANYF
jgi:hypothetical protein